MYSNMYITCIKVHVDTRDETIHFVTIRYVSRYLAHDTIFITIFTACNKCQPVAYISQPTLNLHGLTVPLDLNH